MEQGFFLDRVDVLGDDLVIDETVEDAVAVFTNRADAALPVGNQTTVTAQAAKNLATLFLLLEHGLFH
jgi:hypothetical protein